MHALVTSVLFRVSRLNALMASTELHPPHRQSGQSAGAATRKRRPVVRTNPLRQSKFAKHGFENWLDVNRLRRTQRGAPQ